MRALIHLTSAVDALSDLCGRSLTKGDVEDAFWVVVNNNRYYASGEIVASYMDSYIEVRTDDGDLSLTDSLQLVARVLEALH